MNTATKITHESKALPGVKFTVRQLNQFQRARRDESLIDARARVTEMQKRHEALDEGAETERAKLDHQMGIEITLHLKPAYIRAGLISIEGYTIDGEAPKVDALIESGDDALLDEIYIACVEASGLSAEQQKNSQSPGTSSEAAQPGETNSTATVAAA